MGTCVTVRVRVTELSRGAPVILLKLFLCTVGEPWSCSLNLFVPFLHDF